MSVGSPACMQSSRLPEEPRCMRYSLVSKEEEEIAELREKNAALRAENVEIRERVLRQQQLQGERQVQEDQQVQQQQQQQQQQQRPLPLPLGTQPQCQPQRP